MENPLLVFVSFVIKGMGPERQAVQSAIRSVPLARSWLFEFSPASSLPLAESYLSKVRTCDIFVLRLKDKVTNPGLDGVGDYNNLKFQNVWLAL